MKAIRHRKKFKKKERGLTFLSHAAIATVVCVVIVAIIEFDKGLFKAEFREGDIALRAIYAPYDFTLMGDIDTKKTEAARKKVSDSIPPIYVFDNKAHVDVLKKAAGIISSVVLLKDTPKTDDERISKVREIAASYNISEVLVQGIMELKSPQDFLLQVRDIIMKVMSMGIVSVSEQETLKANNINTITLLDARDDTERPVSTDKLLTLEDAKIEAEAFSSAIIKDKREKSLALDFVNSVFNVNVIHDKEKTEFTKRLESEKILPIYNMIEVKRNELILNKGERIGKGHIEKLKGLEQNESASMKIGGISAITILVGFFTLLVSLYIKFYEPDFAGGNKELMLLGLICILLISAAKIIVVSPWPSNLIPVAAASMLIAILINSRVAIITTCLLSILVGMVSGNRLDIAGVSLAGGIIGIFAMRGVRRRSQLIAAGLCVGFANMSYLIGIGLMRGLDFNTYIMESVFGLANGIMSSVIVTGTLPIFENAFKITTDISLLELSDLNHPLLKEMVIKAPGTYHHSLIVGNLAEAACEATGANALLARVGSYFHDIGKIEKASYFSENQIEGDYAHDRLSPTMSSLIITSHVKNGVELAQRYKLNREIIDIIKQHHGRGLVFYFFKRALETTTDEKVGEQSFRYSGPNPQTKEAACVLLADSVEAGTRALDDPTPSRIKGLVRKIINNKFIDGQLDECDLTLRDLEKIAEVFTHILTGIFHTRVEYPEEPAK